MLTEMLPIEARRDRCFRGNKFHKSLLVQVLSTFIDAMVLQFDNFQ